MIVASMAEVITIASIIPFLSVLTKSETINSGEISKIILNAISDISNSNEAYILTIVFISSILISSLIRVFVLIFQIALTYTIGAELSTSIFEKTIYQPYSTHISRNTSEIISTITIRVNSVIGDLIFPILTIVSSSFMAIAILVSLFLIDPSIAFLMIAILGFFYLTVIFLTKSRMSFHSKNVNYQYTRLVQTIQESLGSIRETLLGGTQSLSVTQFKNSEVPLKVSMAKIQIFSLTPRYIIEGGGIALIGLFAYSMNKNGADSSIPVLGAFALASQRLLPLFQQGYSSFTAIRGGENSVNVALNLLNQPMQNVVSSQKNAPSLIFQNAITITDLSFGYHSEKKILNNVNLRIDKGDRIGLIGETGSGKSTLVDILAGLLFPNAGEMMVDGVVVNERNISEWQKNVAYVPQDIYLVDSTIQMNIALGSNLKYLNQESIVKSANLAKISDFIESLPYKYESHVGERGVKLSGGQKQRIGIARALYRKANFIILDEATSALDSKTEDLIMESIKELPQDITLIIIAHRLDTLRGCNKIFKIDKGSLVQQKTEFLN
jgi:ABC-type multidrug transport system fused ATPase/permease subunit